MAIFQPTAYYNRTNIVTRGLDLYLDPSRPSSYPRTGTIWFDISGNNRSGTLTNGPTFSNGGGGSFVFDGVNDYANTTATLQAPTNSTLQTMSGWMIGDGDMFGSSAAAAGQFHFRVSLVGTTLTYWVTRYGGSSGEGNDAVTVTNKNSVANHVTVVKTAAEKYDVYLNAVKVLNQVTKKATVSTSFWPGIFYTGQYNPHTAAEYTFYNRALSADEISHNYNATRSRFGV